MQNLLILFLVIGGVIEYSLYVEFFAIAPPVITLFIHYSLSVLCYWGYYKYKGEKPRWHAFKEKPKWISLYIAGDTLGNFSWYTALIFIGLSGTTALGSISKIIVIIYGVKVLKEKFTPLQVLASLVIIGGTILYAGAGTTEDKWGVLCVLMSELFYTISYIAEKHVALRKEGQKTILMVRMAIHALILAIAFPFMATWEEAVAYISSPAIMGTAIFLALLGGVFIRVVRFNILKTADLSKFHLVLQLRTVLAFFTGWLILGETANTTQIMVSLIMLVSALALLPRGKVAGERLKKGTKPVMQHTQPD